MASSFRGSHGVIACDVDQSDLVKVVGQFMKKQGKIELPANHEFTKTGHGKENSPFDDDWFYYRLASILRHLNYRKKIG